MVGAGQSPSSNGYANNLGTWRSLSLVNYPRPGQVVDTALLSPDALGRTLA